MRNRPAATGPTADTCGMDLELGGKRAVITGGSGGLAVAQALAGEGAHVALVARHRKGLDRAIALLDASRGRTFALVADTSDDQSVRATR